jgi:hypothetical protein
MITKILGLLKNLTLPSFLHLKTLIPTIGLVITSAFGAGMYTQNQIDKVEIAKIEQKYILEITQLKSHIEDINALMKESNSDKQQIVLLLTYTQYLLSVSDFYRDRTQLNIDKSELFKNRFIEYLKVYSGKQDIQDVPFFEVDGIFVNVKFSKLRLPEPKPESKKD